MKRRIMLQALEITQKRIEDVKAISEKDPHVDAYLMQKKLIQELIDTLKSNTDAMVDIQLVRWIDRQTYAGSAADSKLKARQSKEALDKILEENDVAPGQITLDEVIGHNSFDDVE